MESRTLAISGDEIKEVGFYASLSNSLLSMCFIVCNDETEDLIGQNIAKFVKQHN